MSRAHQFRRAAEFRANAGRRHLGHRLATTNQRSRIGLEARSGLDGNRLAGEHGLIEQDAALDKIDIGGDDAA